MLGFLHKGLKALYAEDVRKGVPANTIDKLQKMFAFLADMADEIELLNLPSWRAHTLSGERKGTWSLSVTRNKRLTFKINHDENELYVIDLEDYH